MPCRFAVPRFLAFFLAASFAATAVAQPRSDAHEEYAKQLWQYLHREASPYTAWSTAEALELDVVPHGCANTKTYVKAAAGSDAASLPYGSVVVVEHYAADPERLAAVTACYRYREGYHAASGDWYWAHYLPDGTVTQTVADSSAFGKPGFVSYEEDGRLWVFRIDSPELAEFLAQGELAKHVIRPGAGPGGMTLKAPDQETVAAYAAAKPGFATVIAGGRLWVFRSGSDAWTSFRQSGEPEKHVTRVGAGPLGMTIKASDAETIDAYLTAKPGFVTKLEEGRLWVFAPGSADLAAFEKDGELAKHVIRPGVGPGGMTLKAPDAETLAAYAAAADGFETVLQDGRLWVFRAGSPEWKEFADQGEPEKHVTRVGAGPLGMTVKAADADTLDAYLRAVKS